MVNIINTPEMQPTKKVNLHICGSESTRVSFDQVGEVKTPEATETWRPIGHDFLVDKVKSRLGETGFEVVNETHNLARNGLRYFGLFQVSHKDRQNNERGTIVGLRNAHDKCFPAGLCAGDAPFVCDNLIFHNEVTLARRHTKNILNDLDMVIARTLGKLFGMWNKQDNRIEAYREYDLSNVQVNDLVIRAYQAGAIGNQDSDHDEFSHRNMNSLYNGFTEVYKGNLMALPKRSEALHSVLDGEVGFANSELQAV
jgi:molybdopterin-guanine dinucleotide biosynthesis protein A